MLLVQIIFFLIVVDRVIYLCSFATGKVLFYLFNLVLFTYSITQYAWNMQPSQQYAGILALRAIFLTKAVSLALQAIQIRYGMPHKSTLYRQFLTSKVSRVNYLGYRLYRALPFLYELRCVLDWSCTTTSLTMYDWLKVIIVACSRKVLFVLYNCQKLLLCPSLSTVCPYLHICMCMSMYVGGHVWACVLSFVRIHACKCLFSFSLPSGRFLFIYGTTILSPPPKKRKIAVFGGDVGHFLSSWTGGTEANG